MALAEPKADPRGLKRICPSCGTRYYDLNKRPPACPSCATEFKAEVKTKGRRRAAIEEKKIAKPVVEEEAVDVIAEGDEDTVSLNEVELEEEDEDEAEVLETLEPDLAVEDLEGVDDGDAEDEEEEDEIQEDDAE